MLPRCGRLAATVHCLLLLLVAGNEDQRDAFAQIRTAAHQRLPGGLDELSCRELLSSYQTLDCPFAAAQGGGPPRIMPAELVSAYTANGTIPTAAFFVDDTNNSHVRLTVCAGRGTVCFRHSLRSCVHVAVGTYQNPT
jgi:hypothetical protein